MVEIRMIRAEEVRKMLGDMPQTTFYRLIKEDPEFPRAYRITQRRVVWNAYEVEAWLDRKKGAT